MDEDKSPGRPTVMTEQVVQKLEAAFGYGATDEQAAFYAGISRQTLYNYCTENPEFGEKKEDLKQNPIMIARKAVIDAMVSDPMLAFKYLERKQKDEFSSRAELTGADGRPLHDAEEEVAKKILEDLHNALIDESVEASNSEEDSTEAS